MFVGRKFVAKVHSRVTSVGCICAVKMRVLTLYPIEVVPYSRSFTWGPSGSLTGFIQAYFTYQALCQQGCPRHWQCLAHSCWLFIFPIFLLVS